MQVLKDSNTGILFSPVATGGVWHLQVAVLHYFALDDPDRSLPEQELWPQCSAQLGEGGFLDPGFPKPCGEVLLAGNWYAPNQIPAHGGQVILEVGPVHRRFAVFGPRYWLDDTFKHPSQPEPVTMVPLTWASAFGGPDFPENTVGAGMERILMPWGEKRVPLPQVEDPSTGLITDGILRPIPACPMPIAGDTPSRLALAGTYDSTWREQYWPGFPADIKPEFFMLAQKSQRLPEDYGKDKDTRFPGFFAGGESFRLEGLHPDKPVLIGRLPRLKVRVFATRIAAPVTCGLTRPVQEDAPDTSFEECACRMETVWFFPSIERGLVIYRTVLPCLDYEYSDVIRLFPVVEHADAPETNITYWLEEQRRRIKPVEVPPFEFPPDTDKRINEACAFTRTLEEDMHLALDRVTGLAPSLHISPYAQLAKARHNLKKALDNIDKTRQQIRDFRKQMGHKVRLDPKMFDGMRQKFLDILPRLDNAEARFRELDTTVANAKKQPFDHLTDLNKQLDELNVAPNYRREVDIARAKAEENLARNTEENLWSARTLKLLSDENLFIKTTDESEECVNLLTQSGLRLQDVNNTLLGFCEIPVRINPEEWGLAPDVLPADTLDEEGRLLLPQGLLVPWFEGKECRALAVRPVSDKSEELFLPDNDWIMPGSKPAAQLLAAITIKPVLLCTDPLTAWLLYAEAGDLFSILLTTSPDCELPDQVKNGIAEAPVLFWPVPPLVPEAHNDGLPPTGPGWDEDRVAARAEELAARWSGVTGTISPEQRLLPVSWPLKWAAPSLAGARKLGLDIRQWLCEMLKKQELPAPEPVKSVVPGKNGVPELRIQIPQIDLKGIQKRFNDRISKIIGERKANFDAKLDEIINKANKVLTDSGQQPISIPKKTVEEVLATPFPTEPDPEVLRRLDIMEKKMVSMKGPEMKEKVAEARAMYLDGLERLRRLDEEGRAQLSKALAMQNKKGLELEDLPEWARKMPGIERILQPDAAPPDAAKLRSGGDGISLKDLDLSGEDLRGMDLQNSFLENVNLSGCDLSGVRWEKSILTGVNLSDANLAGSSIHMCSLTGCDLTRTRLNNCRIELAQCNDVRFEDTDFQDAVLKLVTIVKSSFSGMIELATLELATLKDGRLQGVTLRDCSLTKTTFISCDINSVHVQGGCWREAGFQKCTGGALRMTDLEAENMRFMLQCDLEDVTFDGCRLERLCCTQSRLAKLRARRTSMPGAVIDHCEFPNASLAGCKAPEAQIMHCNLEKADLRRFALHAGSLRRTRLVEADMMETNLHAADFYKAVLGQTNLKGANLYHTALEGTESTLRRDGYIR